MIVDPDDSSVLCATQLLLSCSILVADRCTKEKHPISPVFRNNLPHALPLYSLHLLSQLIGLCLAAHRRLRSQFRG